MHASNSSGASDPLILLRRELHANPELSGSETRTAATIGRFVRASNPSALSTHIGGTGLVAILDSAQPGPTVMVRAELDALPIQEATGQPHASTTPGVAHLCGHDGHAAMVAGLASRFAAEPPLCGRVMLLFQPAEETGAGARAMLADPRWGNASAGLPEPDHCVALHNLPGEPMGQVVLCEPIFSCASTGISFELAGLPGHCCSPEHAHNPLHTLGELFTCLLGLGAQLDPAETAQIVLTHAHAGHDLVFGSSPARAKLNATCRAITDAGVADLLHRAHTLVARLAARDGLTVISSEHDVYRAAICNAAAVGVVRTVAAAQNLAIDTRDTPFRWSEDFGEFTARCPGVLFGLGSGRDQPPLHHPGYDFPDELLPIGVTLLEGVTRQLLAE